jgi:hypothetical protein
MRCSEAADDEDPPPALSERDRENDTKQRPEHRDDHTEQQAAPGPMFQARPLGSDQLV